VEIHVSSSERRQLERFRIRVPLRFRPLGLAANQVEHFAETTNVSRGGFFFVTSAPLQVGTPIEATLRMPAEVTGGKPDETHCRARLVHAKPDAYSDGRMGFGAEIEMYIEPKKPAEPAASQALKSPPPAPAKTQT
jgi:hypothetical protein